MDSETRLQRLQRRHAGLWSEVVARSLPLRRYSLFTGDVPTGWKVLGAVLSTVRYNLAGQPTSRRRMAARAKRETIWQLLLDIALCSVA